MEHRKDLEILFEGIDIE